MPRRPASKLSQFLEQGNGMGPYPVSVYDGDGKRHMVNTERNRWEDSPLRPPADYEMRSLTQRGGYDDEADY